MGAQKDGNNGTFSIRSMAMMDEADLAIHGIASTQFKIWITWWRLSQCCRCTGAKDGRDDQVGNWVSFLVNYFILFLLIVPKMMVDASVISAPHSTGYCKAAHYLDIELRVCTYIHTYIYIYNTYIYIIHIYIYTYCINIYIYLNIYYILYIYK